MRSKRGADAIGYIGKIAIVLALVLIISFILPSFTGTFAETIGACQEAGGRCQSACDIFRGETPIALGKDKCPDNMLCCTSEAIREELKTTVHINNPQGKPLISLEIDGHVNPYKHKDTITIVAGKPYKTTINSDLPDGNLCKFYVKKDNKIVSINIINNTEEFQECKDIKEKILQFPQDYSGERYALEIKVFKKTGDRSQYKELKMEATFGIKVESSVKIAGMSGDWSRDGQEEIKLSCKDIDCQSATVYIPSLAKNSLTGSLETLKKLCEQKADALLAGANPEALSTGFHDGKAEITLDENDMASLGDLIFSEEYVDSHVCIAIGTKDADLITILSPQPLKLDFTPPVIPGLRENTLQCEDKGSGCAAFHYQLLDQVTISTLLSQVERSSHTGFISLTGTQLLQRFLRDRSSCPPAGYPIKSSPIINSGQVVFANVCAYATDQVGNKGQPVQFVYKNKALLKQYITEAALRELFGSILTT